jgi:hypothetical protein
MKTFKTFLENAPGMATGAVVGAGDDNSLKMKKMRLWKKIHRRHKPVGIGEKKTK